MGTGQRWSEANVASAIESWLSGKSQAVLAKELRYDRSALASRIRVFAMRYADDTAGDTKARARAALENWRKKFLSSAPR
jgi:hypothetical protein